MVKSGETTAQTHDSLAQIWLLARIGNPETVERLLVCVTFDKTATPPIQRQAGHNTDEKRLLRFGMEGIEPPNPRRGLNRDDTWWWNQSCDYDGELVFAGFLITSQHLR